MKQRLFVLPVVALVALFVPTLSVSAQADPVSILQQFVDARNQADETGAMALVADELRYVDGSACLLANPCVGPQVMRADIQLYIADHAQSTLIGSSSVSGTTVIARAETSNDAVRAAGVDRVVSEYTVDVRDGKLTSFRGVQDASDPQTAAFQTFQRAQQPNAAAAPAAGGARWVLLSSVDAGGTSTRVACLTQMSLFSADVIELAPQERDRLVAELPCHAVDPTAGPQLRQLSPGANY
jgi:hypothetical protein